MSSKGSGHVVRDGFQAHTYSDIGAVLAINSLQENGGEFWWALVPDHEVLNSHGIDTVYVTIDVTGYNPEKFAWADPPATVSGELAHHTTVSVDSQGRCVITTDEQAPDGKFDFTLHVSVDGDVCDLDPEIDMGMPD